MNSISKICAMALASGLLVGICSAQSQKTSDGIGARPVEPRAPIDPAGPDVAPKVEGLITSSGEQPGDVVEASGFDQSKPIEQILANSLLAANEVAIAVGRLAGERSQNAEVKQFSAQLVTDHLAISQELRRIADPGAIDPLAPPLGRRDAADPRRSAAKITDTLPHRTTIGETPLGPQTGASEAATESGMMTDRDGPRLESGGPQRSRLVMRLADVDHRTQEETTSLVRQQLEQQRGTRFDRAYLYVQMTLEMQLIAAMKVTHDESAGSLGSIAQRGQSMAERRLKEASGLVTQLEEAGRPSERTDAGGK